MSTKTYNLKDVILTVNGLPVEGFGESDAISIEKNSDDWELLNGCDGETVFSRLNDDTGIVTLTLLQTSDTNFWLQTFHLVDRQLDLSIGSIILFDPNTGDGFACFNCKFARVPDKAWGKTVGEYTWQILCPRMITANVDGFSQLIDFLP